MTVKIKFNIPELFKEKYSKFIPPDGTMAIRFDSDEAQECFENCLKMWQIQTIADLEILTKNPGQE